MQKQEMSFRLFKNTFVSVRSVKLYFKVTFQLI